MWNIFRILTNKTIMGILTAIIAIAGAFHYMNDKVDQSYQKGYDDATKKIQAQIVVDNAKWKQKIDEITVSHKVDVAKLTEKYQANIDQLQQQLANRSLIKQYTEGNVVLPQKFVIMHDRLAQQIPLQYKIMVSEVNKKQVTLTDFAEVLQHNYFVCKQNTEKLITLQSIVKDYLDKQKLLKDDGILK